MVYELCKKLIGRGKKDLVSKNLELYHLAGRLSDEEYQELAEMLSETEVED